MRRIVMLALGLVVALAPAGVGAMETRPNEVDQGPAILSAAGGQFYGYVTPAMTVQSGGELTYANFDIVQHDVVHDTDEDGIVNKKKDPWCKMFNKGQCPLFWSPRAGLGDVVEVLGLKNVKAGEVYTFFCTLHPGMKGRVVVAN